MFDMKRPCNNCPFREGQGKFYQLGKERCKEIFAATSFQCHKTVGYENFNSPMRQGDKPQQCAGLMSLLSRAGEPNQIMQVGERLGCFDPNKLDHSMVYTSTEAAIKDHSR